MKNVYYAQFQLFLKRYGIQEVAGTAEIAVSPKRHVLTKSLEFGLVFTSPRPRRMSIRSAEKSHF